MDKIVQIRQLKWLIVGGHSFTDRDLGRLKTLRNLEFLLLDSTKTTPEAESELEKSLPKLKIHKSTWRAAAELMLKYKKEKAGNILSNSHFTCGYTIPTDLIADLKECKKRCTLPDRGIPYDWDEIGSGFGDYAYPPRIERAYVDDRESFEYALYFSPMAIIIKGT